MSKVYLYVGCLSFFFLTACIMSPHANFRAHLSSEVGRAVDGPNRAVWAVDERLQRSSVLPNGNMENEYKYRGTCRYFFEYDPETRVIVRWRFTGDKKDCVVVP